MFYVVRRLGTDEIVHVVETHHTGSALKKFEDGLYRKVDLDRYWVDTSDTDPRIGKPTENSKLEK